MSVTSASVALISTHAGFLSDSRCAHLYSDIGSVESISVQFPDNFVDLLSPSVNIDVDKSIILDHVCFQDGAESFKNTLEFFICGAFGNVADEKLLRSDVRRVWKVCRVRRSPDP